MSRTPTITMLAASLLGTAALFLSPGPAQTPGNIEMMDVRVLSVRPHDRTSFTQGFELDGAILWESAGQYNQSSLREVEPLTGVVLRKVDLPDQYFAEGLTIVDDKVIQLTWRAGKAFVYDKSTMSQTNEFNYTGEGWGLAYDADNNRLIMSDGTDRLTFRDPDTFDVIGEVYVRANKQPLGQINELEYVNGWLYANIYRTTVIARIDPASGDVTGLINAKGLLTPQEQSQADVLNGIAYNPATETFLITGKYWPKTFEVEFVPRADGAYGLQLF